MKILTESGWKPIIEKNEPLDDAQHHYEKWYEHNYASHEAYMRGNLKKSADHSLKAAAHNKAYWESLPKSKLPKKEDRNLTYYGSSNGQHPFKD